MKAHLSTLISNVVLKLISLKIAWQVILLTSSDKQCNIHPVIKIKNVHIDWFPAQINDYIKDS